MRQTQAKKAGVGGGAAEGRTKAPPHSQQLAHSLPWKLSLYPVPTPAWGARNGYIASPPLTVHTKKKPLHLRLAPSRESQEPSEFQKTGKLSFASFQGPVTVKSRELPRLRCCHGDTGGCISDVGPHFHKKKYVI